MGKGQGSIVSRKQLAVQRTWCVQMQVCALPVSWVPMLLQQMLLLLPFQVLSHFYSADRLERQHKCFSHILGISFILARQRHWRWLGSSEYPASLCLFVKFREPHAGGTCPGHGRAAGQEMCEEALSLGKCAHHCTIHTPLTASSPPAFCLAETCPSLPCSPEQFVTIATFLHAGRAQISARVRSPSHSLWLEGKDRA